jgi:rare lipoprotein A
MSGIGSRIVLAVLLSALPGQNGRVLHTQVGEATFYAKHFEGSTTASGRPFEGGKAVAAHRTYPFGTVVLVTNLRNGKSVRVVIVDRGPYGKNRREGAIIDVSPAAAARLGMLRDGQVRVRLQVLAWGKRKTTVR